MTASESLQGEDPSSGELSGLADLEIVRSALLLETSGRVRERAGPGDREGLRRAAALTAAVHSTAVHLGEVSGTGAVSQVVIQGSGRWVLLATVQTRSVPLLLLLVCDGEEDDQLRDGLAAFLERMKTSTPAGDGGRADELEASLLEGLERLFPPDDELVV